MFGAGGEIENQRGILLLLCCPGSALRPFPAHSEIPLAAIPTPLNLWIRSEMPLLRLFPLGAGSVG